MAKEARDPEGKGLDLGVREKLSSNVAAQLCESLNLGLISCNGGHPCTTFKGSKEKNPCKIISLVSGSKVVPNSSFGRA